jgi:hypothetical protein
MSSPRSIADSPAAAIYRDPADLIWQHAAQSLGFRVMRSPDVYASYDGQGCILIGEPSQLDADDCLAQLVFHELCHALVEHPDGRDLPDWGLENIDDRHLHREWASLRVQARLAQPHGLRAFFAPTTEHRRYYEGLPADPLASAWDENEMPVSDGAVELAHAAFERSQNAPWVDPLTSALHATKTLADAIAFASSGTIWSRS